MANTKRKRNRKAKSHGGRTTKSDKAGITFPVGRIRRRLKQGRYADRIADTAAVTLASSLQYLVHELLTSSKEAGADRRINPRYIFLATKKDEDMAKILKDVTIAGSGVLPINRQDRMQ